MRAFVAIDLPEIVRDVLEDLHDRIPAGRLLDPDTLHLTLAFLDEQPQDLLEQLHDDLSSIRALPFEVQLRGLGTFGSRAPRVVWAGIETQPALTAMHEKVRGAARLAGIELRRERYRPHVTLARLPDRLEPGELEKLRNFLERWQNFPCPPFEVSTFTLFQSILTPDGAIHDPLAEYPL